MSKDKRSIQKLRREVEKTKRALSSTHQARASTRSDERRWPGVYAMASGDFISFFNDGNDGYNGFSLDCSECFC